LACGTGPRSEIISGTGNGVTAEAEDTAPDDDDETGFPEKLDVMPNGDGAAAQAGECRGGPGSAGSGDGEIEFSYIWIANSADNTVSKIDTFKGVEIGRYRTGPPNQASPSRTSVNLYGDVAVANRGSKDGIGGVTKIAARLEDCVDRNDNGEIDTSWSRTSVLPWGGDECVLWNLPIASDGYEHGPRPIAWEGKVLANGCADPDPRLWVAWYDFEENVGRVYRMESQSGAIVDSVDIPWNGLTYGPYGGAVNKEGDFWITGWQAGPLVHLDGATLVYYSVTVPQPPLPDRRWTYGMSLDRYGNPWLSSEGAAARYDVELREWEFISTGNNSMRGLMVDREDRAFFAVDGNALQGCGLAVVDVPTRTLLSSAIKIPGCLTPVGISIDVQGYVWVVDQGANAAFKVDPDTYQVVLTVEGLISPYTYSDMTGAGLNLVVNNPVG
jgi:DNA-binding beta-propeller fold protein YncE